MEDGYPDEFEMPGTGGGFDFRDVTDLFERAHVDMESDEVVLMGDLTLQDAMSALEIGEPSLDTGFIAEDQERPPFDPLTPLLPEEVCWVLDQAMAYEMEFHSGGVLAHTIYTLLYVHHLQDIDPDVVLKWMPQFNYDHRRPLVLITVVLRTAVQALLKCVDLSWRELANGDMYDAEDWQSDKCDVSLLEGIPTNFIIQKLDAAITSVSQSLQVPSQWKSALTSRLFLRQTLLKLMSISASKDHPEFTRLILRAREYLHAIKGGPSPSHPPPHPSQTTTTASPVAFAFDPRAGRRLQMATPIRVVSPPSFEDACKAVECFLDGLYDVALLSGSEQLSTWQTVADVQAQSSGAAVRMPYVRSLTQTIFYERCYASKKYSSTWLINQFFYESCGQDYDSLRPLLLDGTTQSPPGQNVVTAMEICVSKLTANHIKALFSNPCRRRRKFMKSLGDWHRLYESLASISAERIAAGVESLAQRALLDRLPDVALVWRLSMLRDVVLSGFQLELYSDEEKPFAYWYAVKIVEEHLRCLDGLLLVVPDGSDVETEVHYQSKFLTVLQLICTASFMVSISLVSFDWERTKPNFLRRYKWAFKADREREQEQEGQEESERPSRRLPVVAQPDLHQFIVDCEDIVGHHHHHHRSSSSRSMNGDAASHVEVDVGALEEEEMEEEEEATAFLSPAECIGLAEAIARGMVTRNEAGSWAGAWANDRVDLMKNLLINVCANLSGLPRTREEVRDFDAKKRLAWDPNTFHPWFPKMLPGPPLA